MPQENISEFFFRAFSFDFQKMMKSFNALALYLKKKLSEYDFENWIGFIYHLGITLKSCKYNKLLFTSMQFCSANKISLHSKVKLDRLLSSVMINVVSLLASIFLFSICILKKNETVILHMKKVNIR